MENNLYNFITRFIVYLCGTGIMSYVSKLIAKKTAEGCMVKFQHELDKKLESHKTSLENKNYVSKARFDTEFSVCKELMMACRTMIDDTYNLFPNYVRGEEKCTIEKQNKAILSHSKFTKLLAGYAPFITESLYNSFFSLSQYCALNIDAYYYRLQTTSDNPVSFYDVRDHHISEAYIRSREYDDRLLCISNDMRAYFSSIEIMK